MGLTQSQPPSEEQEKKDRKRLAVVNEIVQTEDTYSSCLDIIVRVYQAPLEEAVAQGKPIITQEEVVAVFANIREIQQLHANLVKELRDAQGGAENGPFTHVFVKYVSSFRIYTEFVNNYNNSLDNLSRCQKKKKAFQQFLADANRHSDCRGRDLPTFLITPIQRLPRYILLLQELQKLTPSKHKDYKNIGRALSDIKQMTDYINREKQVAEMYQKLLQIQEAFVDDISLLSKQRQLVQEGEFNYRRKSKKGFKPGLHFFLFNDMLLLARPRSAVGRVSSLMTGSDASWEMSAYSQLSQVEVQDIPDSKDEEFCILLVIANKEYVVKFGSQQEKEQCMNLFFTTKSKSHRVAFVDIIAVSSSSRSVPVASPRNDGRAAAEKEKLAKEKEKEKQAKEKEEKKKRETLKKEKGKEKKGDKKGKGKGKKEEPPADALTSIMNGFSSFCSSIAGPAPEESKGKKNKK